MATDPLDEAKALSAEISGLLFAISHDLRAPVRAITGFTQLLNNPTSPGSPPDPAEVQRYLARIASASTQLQDMLEGMTQLARVSQHPPALNALDVHALCISVQHEAATRYGFTLELDVAAGLISTGDPALLRMALLALVDNAWKFSKHLPTPQIRLTARRDQDRTTLCVSDNGLGFDPRYQHRLGIPFQHLHTQKELAGLGMGLAIVRRITALHHGYLTAEGTPDAGSRFSLVLAVT